MSAADEVARGVTYAPIVRRPRTNSGGDSPSLKAQSAVRKEFQCFVMCTRRLVVHTTSLIIIRTVPTANTHHVFLAALAIAARCEWCRRAYCQLFARRAPAGHRRTGCVGTGRRVLGTIAIAGRVDHHCRHHHSRHSAD